MTRWLRKLAAVSETTVWVPAVTSVPRLPPVTPVRGDPRLLASTGSCMHMLLYNQPTHRHANLYIIFDFK